MITRRHWLAGTLALAAAGARAADGEPGALERVRRRGHLVVGVYNALPPFHAGGQGIDVELAQALSRALGVQLSLLPFSADEDMDDDLRHMVWKGHYLGYGPADVLLHVPVEAPLMQRNPQVRIFAPYYRERIRIARDLARVPAMASLAAFRGHTIAVPGQSLAGWLLLGADDGAWRAQLATRWADGTEAAAALARGEVAAAAGTASELESVLGGDPRFAIEALPVPRGRDGWAVGMAVKQGAGDLAEALQAATTQLAASGELAQLFARHRVAWQKP